MNLTFRVLLTIAFTCALAPCSYAVTAEDMLAARLMNDAQRVAAESFPQLCGANGEYCNIAVDGRRECAREFVMTYPMSLHAPSASRGAMWVTIDSKLQVVAVSLTKEGSCRNERSPYLAS